MFNISKAVRNFAFPDVTTSIPSNGHAAAAEEETNHPVVLEDHNTNTNDDHGEEEELVWYFSYGSNMNPAVFEMRRKIKCRDHRVCKVPGYVLTYAEGVLPYIEPAFCTCIKRSDLPSNDRDGRPDIHGVAFLITKLQYEQMLLTEGGWGYQEYRTHPIWSIGHYGEEEIRCVEILPEGGSNVSTTNHKQQPPPPTTTSFQAFTLVGLLGVHQRYDCNASKRYYDLVNSGAKSSGLPTSYREYLTDRHPAYEPRQCWRAALSRRLYFSFAFPSIFLELGSLQLCVLWNERKLKQKRQRQQQQRHVANDASSTTTTTTPTTPEPKTRPPFEDVLRPPWIIMKLSCFYRSYVLERMLSTVLFDWCKFPNGYRNTVVVAKATAIDSIAPKKLQ